MVGLPVNFPDKQAKREIQPDEKEMVTWVNEQFQEKASSTRIQDISKDFRSGVKLLELVQVQ